MTPRALPALLALLAGGCTMAPHYERPPAPVPAALPTGGAYRAATDESSLPVLDRTVIFKDQRLQALMNQALANNRDLRVAAANIARARAQFHVQRAGLLPQLNAAGQIQSTDNALSSTTATAANLSVSAYELDLFGRIQSLSKEALERYFASEAAARATRLALLGDIASGWLGYAADKSLLMLAQDTEASARKTVELTRARLEGGVAPRTDLAQALTILATAQSDLARQQTALAQDVNGLTLLVGATIDPAQLPDSIEEASATIGDPPAGTSSQILLRRPDVLSAEYSLRAANADIGAARAALFPKISLSGLVGLTAGSFEKLFGDAGRSALQGTAAASYPIFSFGAGRANLKISKAQRDAALATYEKSVQTAFREVADALARRGTIDDQLGADSAREQASAEAFQLSQARYQVGIDSFLQALVTQRALYTAQKTLIATQLEAARNRVTLYRALGGDALTPAKDEPAEQ